MDENQQKWRESETVLFFLFLSGSQGPLGSRQTIFGIFVYFLDDISGGPRDQQSQCLFLIVRSRSWMNENASFFT